MDFIKKNLIIISSILLLLVMLGVLFINAKEESQTMDEGVYIASGYAQYKFPDKPINTEHPPLAKYLAGISGLLTKSNLSSTAISYLEKGNQYAFASEFLYKSNNNADKIIFYARLPFIILALILGIVIFFFARFIFKSDSAGLLSLFFYALSPSIIAHAHLATNDFLLTFFYFLTFMVCYLYFQKPSAILALMIGVLSAGAFLVKYSGLMAIAVVLLIFIIRALWDKKYWQYLWHFFIIILSFIAVCWLVYLSLDYPLSAYFDGLKWQIARSQGGGISYLWGDYSAQNGWWYYYILAFLIKTPIATIILLIISIISWVADKFKNWKENLTLIIPPIFLLVILLLSKINIGLRYALPIYPFIFLAIGSIALLPLKLRSPKKWKYLLFNILLSICCIWYFIAFIIISPYQLTYFNEFVGEPKNGYKYLIDSNIDWGQDLKRLKIYMDKNNINEIYLAYFGNADPDYYQINYQKLPYDAKPEDIHGWVAISVQNFRLPFGYFDKDKENYDGFYWLEKYEPVDRLGNSLYIYNIK